jgi:hypothetical protein
MSAFQTKNGAVVYSFGGSLNCDERVTKSDTLISLIIVFLQEKRKIIQDKRITTIECLIIRLDFMLFNF